jgi:hypothetical protein
MAISIAKSLIANAGVHYAPLEIPRGSDWTQDTNAVVHVRLESVAVAATAAEDTVPGVQLHKRKTIAVHEARTV